MALQDSRGLRTTLRGGASGLALAMALAGVASAQDAAPAPDAAQNDNAVEEIIVTGFRASLASAINVKRNASGVVDAIKAEDIAQFPDLNLAESLQRIPGVSISRINGEGRQISVRGLGSEYTRVRINGMEAITTTGGTANSGGTNRGRGFDFNIFASDLFNSIAVRKTASAEVEEGSLGATVDLDTASPFDNPKPQLVLSAQASYNDLAKDAGPRLSALASRTWRDGTFGALVSVAYEKRHLLEEGRQHHALDLWRQQRRLQPAVHPARLHPGPDQQQQHRHRALPPAHPGLCQLRHRIRAVRRQRLAAMEAHRPDQRLVRRALLVPGRDPQGGPAAGAGPVARRHGEAPDHHPRRRRG